MLVVSMIQDIGVDSKQKVGGGTYDQNQFYYYNKHAGQTKLFIKFTKIWQD